MLLSKRYSPLWPANTVARWASSYSPLGLASQNSIRALRIGLHSSAARTLPESTYPLPTLVRTGAPGQHEDKQGRRERASKPYTLLPRDHGCSFPKGHGMYLLW